MTMEWEAILVLTTVQKAWLGFIVPVRAEGVVGVAGFPGGGASIEIKYAPYHGMHNVMYCSVGLRTLSESYR